MLLSLIINLFAIVSSCNILSLSGGGVYGSFEAGVVSHLAERNHTWDIITGVSAGGINAGYLSTIESGEEKNNVELFKQIWTSIKNEDVYMPSYFLNGFSLYDNTPLASTYDRIYNDRVPIRPVKISATSLKQGGSFVFTNEDIIKYGFTNILMSSTAIPILFPPYQFLDDIFVDGGVTSNILVNEAINFCQETLPGELIYIDVIICRTNLGNDTDLQMHFKDIANRLISIIGQEIMYSELRHPILEDNIFITVYEQRDPQGYDLLDFTATEALWYQGYNYTNVEVYWINNTRGTRVPL